jgi:hypothetical protein
MGKGLGNAFLVVLTQKRRIWGVPTDRGTISGVEKRIWNSSVTDAPQRRGKHTQDKIFLLLMGSPAPRLGILSSIFEISASDWLYEGI